jgi:hypothetical protein
MGGSVSAIAKICAGSTSTQANAPDVLDDSGPSKDENENGKKPVGRVMKAPGDWMKLRRAVDVGLECASAR